MPEPVMISTDNQITASEAWPDFQHAWSTVGLLMLAYFMSSVDRSILSLLVEPIKKSLHLSDTQIGLLQGAAFGLLFMVMTFPAGWITDRGARMRLIGWGITCWSIMTAACGLCTTFAQLFLARMGVAVGEATLTPAGPSLISDNFPPERRTLPITVYGLGAGLGSSSALIAGGFIASLISGHASIVLLGTGPFEPWQVIFFAMGLPGLLLSVMFYLAHEPQRRDREKMEGSFSQLAEVMNSRWTILVPHFSAATLYQVNAYALSGWAPAYFMRVHGWSMTEVGLRYGTTNLIFGIMGAVGGGLLARKLWQSGRRNANFLTSAILFALMIVPAVSATMVPNALANLMLLGLTVCLTLAAGGATSAALQEIIPNRLRGRITSIYYAIVALGGMTVGPLIIGVMNDNFFMGSASVGKSMALTALLTIPLASVLMFVAGWQRKKFDSAY